MSTPTNFTLTSDEIRAIQDHAAQLRAEAFASFFKRTGRFIANTARKIAHLGHKHQAA